MNKLAKIAEKLRKIADVCPQCGSALALNGPTYTECPNPNCPNYSVLQDQRVRTNQEPGPIAPAGSLEYSRDAIPNIVELSVVGKMWNIAEVGLADPIKYELNTVLGNRVYVVQIPLPFKHTMIPSQYKTNASSTLIRINMNGVDVYIHNMDENTYYMKDSGVLAKFLEALNVCFGNPQYQNSNDMQQVTMPNPEYPNDLARHPVAPPLANRLY